MELTSQAKKTAARCEDCGFEFPGEGKTCCPRCGAALGGAEDPLPDVPYEAVNPYGEKYELTVKGFMRYQSEYRIQA